MPVATLTILSYSPIIMVKYPIVMLSISLSNCIFSNMDFNYINYEIFDTKAGMIIIYTKIDLINFIFIVEGLN